MPAQTSTDARVERRAGIGFAALLLIGWEAASRGGLFDALILPAPGAIVVTLVENLLGGGQRAYPIWQNTLASLGMLAIAFPVGALLGVLCGVLIGASETAYRVMGPLLAVLVPIPAISWYPHSMMWFRLCSPPYTAFFAHAHTAHSP